MVRGIFKENTPFIKVIIAWGQVIQASVFVLDTGFTGDLQVTANVARNLKLKPVGVVGIQIANGETIEVPVALAIASLEGRSKYVDVLISDSIPLVGINFLSKFLYKAIIDCKYKTVLLKKV